MNADKSRVTVVETVTHNPGGGLPQDSVTTRYCRWLNSNEQAYIRSLQATHVWSMIDRGWLSSLPLGTIVIKNEMAQAVPRLDMDDQYTLQIGIVSVGSENLDNLLPLCPISSQESMRLPGLDQMIDLYVRTNGPVCRYSVNLIPW